MICGNQCVDKNLSPAQCRQHPGVVCETLRHPEAGHGGEAAVKKSLQPVCQDQLRKRGRKVQGGSQPHQHLQRGG